MRQFIIDKFLIVLVCVVALVAVVAILCNVRAQASMTAGAIRLVAGAQQAPPRTEQQIADDIIKDVIEWTALIGDRPADRNAGVRRVACGAILDALANGCNPDRNFHDQLHASCAALEFYFPSWRCQACEN